MMVRLMQLHTIFPILLQDGKEYAGEVEECLKKVHESSCADLEAQLSEREDTNAFDEEDVGDLESMC